MVSHTDGVSAIVKSEVAQVGKAGFNCDCQHLVAESPFTADSQYIDLTLLQDYTTAPSAFYGEVHAIALFSHSLRGPPALS